MPDHNETLPMDYGGPVDWPFEPFPVSALEGTIKERFDAIARRYPQRPAIADRQRSLTYAGLAALAGDIAAAVSSATADRPGPVAILLPHAARYPAAMFGALAAGRGCVPLDADHPLERNRLVAGHAAAVAVISAGELAARARALFAGDLPVLDIDALGGAARSEIHRPPAPDDLAFIIYTSGSTGAPKGVYQNHVGVLQDIMQCVNSVHMSCEDTQALFYSPSVIAGLRITLSALLSGASLRVLAPVELGPAGVAREVRALRITLWNSSPSLFRHVVETLAPDEKLDPVRNVLLGGDRVDWADYDLFRRACLPGAVMRVHLGSTECWTVHTQWYVDERVRGSSPRLPVGRAIPDRPVTIVGEDGQPVPDGAVGEIVVSSRYIALGYWRDPELTTRAFTIDPADPGIRSYRTGDLALRRPDGLLEFVGRKDHQIKLAGRRIEPAEIEAALRQCAGVRDAAVVVRNTAAGLPRALVAYVDLHAGFGGVLPRHLMAMLTPRLPRHMLPAAIFVLDTLPALPTFKVDRSRLAKMDARNEAQMGARKRGKMVDEVTKVIEKVLRITGATPEDNLASLGADSLQAIGVAIGLQHRFGVEVPPDSFEMTDSVRELARRIAVRLSRDKAGEIPRAGKGGAPKRRSGRTPRPVPKARGNAGDGSAVSKQAAAVDSLFKEGRFEAAREGVLELLGEHPNLQLAKNLERVFDRLPPADGSQTPFQDNPKMGLQVARRDHADTALLVFSGIQDGVGIPLPAIHRWLGRLPAHLVYLRDFRRAHYFAGLRRFGPDRNATIAGLRELISGLGARRIVCLGNSAGTIAALRYGLDLGAEAVVALGGPINFSREFNTHLRSARLAARLQKTFPGEMSDVRGLYAEARTPPRALIVHSDNAWDDRLHAEYLAGLPSVMLLPIENSLEHNVIIEVIKRGWFEKLLDWLVTPGGCALPAVIPAPAGAGPRPAAETRRGLRRKRGRKVLH